jgi:hypothetical protein
MWPKPLFALDIEPVSFNIIIQQSGDCIPVLSPHCPLPFMTSTDRNVKKGVKTTTKPDPVKSKCNKDMAHPDYKYTSRFLLNC